MTKGISPLLGYNNNVRHKNRVFHIQTEDSGIKHPHIITHLFMDGGRILKSIKTSYKDHLGKDKLQDLVKQMMKDQHKAMFKALRDGAFDKLLEDMGSQPNMAAVKKATAAPPPPEEAPKTTREHREEAPEPTRAGEVQTSGELTLDLDALDRAAAAGADPFVHEAPELPPPPAQAIRDRAPPDPGTGRYRTLQATEERLQPARARSNSPSPKSERPPPAKSERPPRSERPPPSARPATKSSPAQQKSRPPARKSERPPSHSEQPLGIREENASRRRDPRAEPSEVRRSPSNRPDPRFAPARPAAIFGQAKPQQGSSIFGEDIISDKSLDEVILSYLAEDLDEGGGGGSK